MKSFTRNGAYTQPRRRRVGATPPSIAPSAAGANSGRYIRNPAWTAWSDSWTRVTLPDATTSSSALASSIAARRTGSAYMS